LGEGRLGFCDDFLVHVPGDLAFGGLLLRSALFLSACNRMTFEALLL
jgi:hypothetical protein